MIMVFYLVILRNKIVQQKKQAFEPLQKIKTSLSRQKTDQDYFQLDIDTEIPLGSETEINIQEQQISQGIEHISEMKKVINIFISYSLKDGQSFKIKEITDSLSSYKEIGKILYNKEDVKDEFMKFRNLYIDECDVMILFCSLNALKSISIEEEWIAAHAKEKPIIPVYIQREHIPLTLRDKLGVEFDPFDLQSNIDLLHYLILKKTH